MAWDLHLLRTAFRRQIMPSRFWPHISISITPPPPRVDTPVPGLADEEVRTIRKKFDPASEITALVEQGVREMVHSGLTVQQALQQLARDTVISSSPLCWPQRPFTRTFCTLTQRDLQYILLEEQEASLSLTRRNFRSCQNLTSSLNSMTFYRQWLETKAPLLE